MKRTAVISSIAGLLCTVFFTATVFIPLDGNDFRKENIHSLKVLDRNGKLLREFLNDDEGRGEWVPYAGISKHVIDAVISAEDKRFHSHIGIDPLATGRALYRNVFFSGRSGGSTITQQLIRNVYHHPRTVPYKMLEAWYALRLERMMGKEEILEHYLNRAPFGNQLNGVQAASRYYFDKPAAELSIAEAAFLAGLPNSPSFLNPYQNYNDAMKRQKKVLQQLHEQKKIRQDEYERALLQPIPIVTPDKKFRAPHAVELTRAQFSGQQGLSTITTTIDIELQNNIQWIVRGHVKQLEKKKVSNAAVIVLHNKTGEVRTLIGSADYFNNSISGQFNGATALRQPGSALKPYTYAVALEAGFTPSTLLADVPTSIPAEGGNYVPENYDREYHGPVRLRTALACSYNIPAVRILHSIGSDALYQRLMLGGITSFEHPPAHYGFGLTLGNAEVSLIELTNAYRVFANGGVWLPLKLVHSAFTVEGAVIDRRLAIEEGEQHEVFTEEISYLISDILKDHSARMPAFGNHFRFSFPCVVKTGTTKDYKDNWTIGYTPEYTVGVWVGNFNGTPMVQVSGVTGAGQIFTDIMNLIMTEYDHKEKEFKRPAAIVHASVCSRSGKLPTALCGKLLQEVFINGNLPRQRCDIHKKYFIRKSNGSYEAKVFEIFPAEYKEWCELENLPQPPPDAFADRASGNKKTNQSGLAISFPHPGDVFKIDPVLRKEYQKIKVDALLPRNITKVLLIVNGKEFIPFGEEGVWWELKKGEHTFQLCGLYAKKRVSSSEVKVYID